MPKKDIKNNYSYIKLEYILSANKQVA